jgi:hypothetical protein
LDEKKFAAIVKDPVTAKLADGYMQAGMDQVEASDKAVGERLASKYGKGGGKPVVKKERPAGSRSPGKTGTPEVAGGVKKTFTNTKPIGEMTMDEKLDASFNKLMENMREDGS